MKKPTTKKAELKPHTPDITKLVAVDTGDNLPTLALGVYKSEYPNTPVEYNLLNKFREVPPGETLDFPPLSGSAD